MTKLSEFKLNEFLPYRLSILSNTISGYIADIYEEKYALSLTGWRIICILANYKQGTATDIVDYTAMDKVAVSRGVKKLLERGIIERKPDANDRRKQTLRLTDIGHEVYNEVIPKAIQYEEKIIEQLNAKDLADIDRIVNKLFHVTNK